VAAPVTADSRRAPLGIALLIAGMIALRLVAAAITPLTFDEAYYWSWSKHLALGYFDHPPMVAVVIRLGTMLAGDTEFGVRLVSILLAIPMSFAVWRAAELLFGDPRLAASAVVLFNATMMVSVGTVIVTPDAPLLAASCFVLYALAQVASSGRGAWWLAAGAAVGLALLSKYTALFFGPAILVWLLWVGGLRRWLVSPWPYLGGMVAIALFLPVIVWNADHHWMSFIKQFSKARIEQGFGFRFLSELIPTQFMLATPAVFILGAMGLYALRRRSKAPQASRVLIGATVWTCLAYFTWQATHSRVEGNWFGLLYPAFALAAAVAATAVAWAPRTQRVVDFCRRWAAPTGAVLFALLVLQANTGMLTGYRRDASARAVGVGIKQAAAEIEATRVRLGATCVLADDYGTTGWLSFYLPQTTCVAQRNERFRWLAAPSPTAEQLGGPLLLVGVFNAARRPDLQAAFASVQKVGMVNRNRGPVAVDTIELTLLENPRGEVLDRSPPAAE
jgi:4-amino-4-deoxy-L-arabinose transferase-like glycosyltransferase